MSQYCNSKFEISIDKLDINVVWEAHTVDNNLADCIQQKKAFCANLQPVTLV